MSHAIKQYLSAHKITLMEAAYKLGIHYNHLAVICRGTTYPSRKLAERIEHYTDGAVKARDIINPKHLLERKRCPCCTRMLPMSKVI
jgi:hypothetical protein